MASAQSAALRASLARRHLSWSATLSMAALTQTSSFSPPGAPETPAAPMTSSPTMIGSAPRAVVKPVRNWLFHLARRNAEGAGGEGLLEAVLHGVRSGAVAADLDEHFAVAADDGGRHAITVRRAGRDGGLRDRDGDVRGQILAREKLCARGRDQSTGQADGGQAIRHHRHDGILPWRSRPLWCGWRSAGKA